MTFSQLSRQVNWIGFQQKSSCGETQCRVCPTTRWNRRKDESRKRGTSEKLSTQGNEASEEYQHTIGRYVRCSGNKRNLLCRTGIAKQSSSRWNRPIYWRMPCDRNFRPNYFITRWGRFCTTYYQLLIKPCIVEDTYWKRGYFSPLIRRPVPSLDSLSYGFWSYRKQAFQTVKGELLERTPKIMGIYGLTTITGVASEMKRALIAKGIL